MSLCSVICCRKVLRPSSLYPDPFPEPLR
ncbi:hypothetical protein CCACVL1_10773 [Corchorus capsularis]|uniref:Uncharacterized protein n=1 Tax=Corchorus capsularis TaxID=210143 RepID=A0A1R3IPR6_COCAP|nr:hypothetical protein CCACVL1_10773 [Corchorus capsularis]